MDFNPDGLITERMIFAPEDAEAVSRVLRTVFSKKRVAALTPREAAPLFGNLQSLIIMRAIAGDYFEPHDWLGYPEIKKDYGTIEEEVFYGDILLLSAINRRLAFSDAFADWLGAHTRAFWQDCKASEWFPYDYRHYADSTPGMRYEFIARILSEFFDRLYRDTRVNFMPPMFEYEDFTGWTLGTFNEKEDKITVSGNYKNEDAFGELIDTLSHEMTHCVISQLRKIKKPTPLFPFPADIALATLKHEHNVYADGMIKSVYWADSEETICRAQSDIVAEIMRPLFGFASAEDREHERSLRIEKWNAAHGYKTALGEPSGFLPPDKD